LARQGSRFRRVVMDCRVRANSRWKRLRCLATLCLLAFSPGCARFSLYCDPRHILAESDPPLSNVSFFRECESPEISGDTQPFSPLQRMKALAARGAEPIARLRYRCQDKIAAYREAANPPPWPKFHPVPVQPAFTPRETELVNAPDSFGSFGPSPE
jgi:hypothetical protein